MRNGFKEYSWGCAVVAYAITMLAACGGASATRPLTPAPPGQPPLVSAATVNATPALAFTPADIHLVQGGAVTFSFGSVGHDVFFDDDPAGAPADIPGVNSNTSVTRTFDTPGTFAYNCHIHPGMQGTVEVFAPDTL